MEYEKFQEHYLAEKVEELWEVTTNAKVGKEKGNWQYKE